MRRTAEERAAFRAEKLERDAEHARQVSAGLALNRKTRRSLPIYYKARRLRRRQEAS